MRKFLQKDRGATITEYALVVGIMALVAIGGRTVLTDTAERETERNRDCISQVPPDPVKCPPAEIPDSDNSPPTGPPPTPPPPPPPPGDGENPGGATGSPFGSFGALTGFADVGKPKQLRVTGWTIDPDTINPIQLNAYLNGNLIQTVTANVPREDVSATYPVYGPNHGFDFSFNAPAGANTVCLTAMNFGAGDGNTPLGCKSLTVPTTTGIPFGNVDSLNGVAPPRQLNIAGWAIDPDTTKPIAIHVYVNGIFTVSTTANVVRSDVGSAHPYYGSRHGFNVSFNTTSGTKTVCAYAINVGAGSSNPLLGCRTMTVPSTTGNPFGSFDLVEGAVGEIRFAGWAIDPDTTAPINLHVYVAGQYAGSYLADQIRSDVGNTYPYYGPAHGYDKRISATAGSKEVCVFAINTGAGNTNTLLGCKTVSVPIDPATK